MKIDIQGRRDRRIAKRSQWHRFYALMPVRLESGPTAWLETVERRGAHFHGIFGDYWLWTYRVPPNSNSPER